MGSAQVQLMVNRYFVHDSIFIVRWLHRMINKIIMPRCVHTDLITGTLCGRTVGVIGHTDLKHQGLNPGLYFFFI